MMVKQLIYDSCMIVEKGTEVHRGRGFASKSLKPSAEADGKREPAAPRRCLVCLLTHKSLFMFQICQNMSLIDANIILTRISRITRIRKYVSGNLIRGYPLNPRQKILFIYFNLRLSDSNLVCEVVPIDACRFPKRSASVAG